MDSYAPAIHYSLACGMPDRAAIALAPKPFTAGALCRILVGERVANGWPRSPLKRGLFLHSQAEYSRGASKNSARPDDPPRQVTQLWASAKDNGADAMVLHGNIALVDHRQARKQAQSPA
jgi:hypothetical protein